MTAEERAIHNIIHSVGLANNLRDSEVYDIINSQFKFIYETTKNMSFSELTDDEIDSLKTSFMLKYIGKIYTNKDIIKKIHNRKSFLKKLKEEYDTREDSSISESDAD